MTRSSTCVQGSVPRAGADQSALAGVLAGELGLGQHRAREGMRQVMARAGPLGQAAGLRQGEQGEDEAVGPADRGHGPAQSVRP